MLIVTPYTKVLKVKYHTLSSAVRTLSMVRVISGSKVPNNEITLQGPQSLKSFTKVLKEDLNGECNIKN